jgi:molybdopterin synthase catalytic subunit
MGLVATPDVADVAITREPLRIEELVRRVSQRGPVGAVATFLGLVRDENAGRRVQYLEYDAYEPLAVRALQLIRDEAGKYWPDARIACHHRVGRLEIGEASIAIAASSPHRGHAFAACRYTIERVKQIAPIWKREYFDGGDVWIEGAVADPDDAERRRLALACAGGEA